MTALNRDGAIAILGRVDDVVVEIISMRATASEPTDARLDRHDADANAAEPLRRS
jgi:hypothetical protein